MSRSRNVVVPRRRAAPWLIGAACAAVLLQQVPLAHAQIYELQHSFAADGVATGLGAALWVTSELLKKKLAPAKCRWCDRREDGTDGLNALDASMRDRFKWKEPWVADVASNVTGFALTPFLSFVALGGASAYDSRFKSYAAQDMLIVVEAAVVTALINQLVKFLVGRERPFVHYMYSGLKQLTPSPADNNLSFFSGHTSFTFALAVGAGTVATLRGYSLAPVVWGVGIPVALLTGYLRIAADKHYFTDVLVGGLVGSAIGYLLPALLHDRQRVDTATGASQPLRPTGPRLVIGWTF